MSGHRNHLDPYDLGCQLQHAELPPGRVRFALSGRRWEAFGQGRLDEAIIDEELPVVLSIFKITRTGSPLRHQQDKRFALFIKPDPASRLPIISQEKDFKSNALPI